MTNATSERVATPHPRVSFAPLVHDGRPTMLERSQASATRQRSRRCVAGRNGSMVFGRVPPFGVCTPRHDAEGKKLLTGPRYW